MFLVRSARIADHSDSPPPLGVHGPAICLPGRGRDHWTSDGRGHAPGSLIGRILRRVSKIAKATLKCGFGQQWIAVDFSGTAEIPAHRTKSRSRSFEFCAKEGLSFKLLADTNREVSSAYGSVMNLAVTKLSARH